MSVMGPPRAPKPVFTLPVEDDPLPWLTDQFRAAGVFATTEGTPKRTPTAKAMSAALGITTSIVSALSDHEKRFYVRFSPKKATAATYLASREVIIGIRPMLDPRLTEGQRAALMVALAYHEVGHVIWTADLQARFTARYEPDGKPNKPARKVFNCVHDILLEKQQAVMYPGYAPTLQVKQAYWGKRWNVRFNSRANRLGALIQATLYPQGTDWEATPEAKAWFSWADDWAERCRSVKAGKSPTYLWGLIDEGLSHLRLDDPDEPDPLKDEDSEEEPPEGTDESDSEEEEGEEPTFDDEDDDEDGDMQDDPLDDRDGDGEDDDGPLRPPDDEEESEEPTFDDEEESETGDDPATDDDSEEQAEDDEPTADEEADSEEEEDESEDGGSSTGQDSEEDDESDEEGDDEAPGADDDDESDEDEDEESGEDGDGESEDDRKAKDDIGRDEFDDPNVPQAHPEGEDDAEKWQDAIDEYDRVQVRGRDKVVVGGGAWARREARIIRL